MGRAQQAPWMEGKVLRADLAAPFTGPPTHPAWVRPTLEERPHAGGGLGGLSGGGGAHKRLALMKLDALREPEGGLEVAGQAQVSDL